MITNTSIEAMNTVLGSNYQFVTDGLSDPIVLAKLPDEDLRSIPDATREEYNLTPENLVRRSLAPKNSVINSEPAKNAGHEVVGVRGFAGEISEVQRMESRKSNTPPINTQTKPREKTTDDYIFQFYLGSLTVVGLFVLFRMIQKSH
jgi:hypothetical protein